MWRFIFACLTVLAMSGSLGPARANDSTAQLGVGGLILARTGDIQMVSEELFVSRKQIKVVYVFRNKTDKDIETLVAFPLPDLQSANDDGDVAIPFYDRGADFVGFTTNVDGKPVKMQVEQRALVAGLDQTAVLLASGIPIEHFVEGMSEKLTALAPALRDALAKLGLVRFEEQDFGQGMKTYTLPNWTLKTTFYWRQVFPAGRDLKVEHRYSPSVGSIAGALLGSDFYGDADVKKHYEDTYCPSAALLEAANKLRAGESQPDSGYYLSEYWVDYILKTGGNWAGGAIGNFRLVVDTGGPDNLVSLCHLDLKPIGNGRFEFTAKDFWPEHDLKFILLEKTKSE